MQKNAIIAIVAAVVVVAAIGAAAVFVMTNDSDDSETYYFYISSEDKAISGWHSGKGTDAAAGFADAMKKDNIEFELNSSGYLSKLGTHEGYVYSAFYVYNNTSKEAAEGSLSYNNGWKDVAGYNKTGYTGDKVAEINAHVFFYAMYAADYSHPTPESDKAWMTTGPFEKEIKLDDKKQDYHFYISSDDTAIAGWHSGKGNNAAEGFADAMKKDNIAFEISSSGYLSKLGTHEGYVYSTQYVYTDLTKEAAEASISYNNGWKDIAGYNIPDYTGDKVCEFEANVYFYAMYAADYSHPTPESDKAWMTTGPFSN